MELLICDEQQYASSIQPFEQYLEPIAKRMDKARDARNTELSRYQDRPNKAPLLERYCAILRWPIRKLEYSYAINSVGDLSHGHRVLEAGCGITPLCHYFAATGAQVDAVDGDQILMDMMSRNAYAIYGSHVQYSPADITAMRFPDDYFDVVTCISVLEHLPRGADTDAMREMLRVLKPGGLLIATVDVVADDWITEKAQSPSKGASANGASLVRISFGAARRLLRRVLAGPTKDPTVKKVRTQPYFYHEAVHQLITPFEKHLLGRKIDAVDVATKRIRQFWRDHWFDGANYDRQTGRSYTALGFTLQKRVDS